MSCEVCRAIGFAPHEGCGHQPEPEPDLRTVRNASQILLASFKYREACDAVQPAWEHMVLRTRTGTPERAEAHTVLKVAMQRARELRDELMKIVLDGRSEVPR